jgi:hypothetical protein
MDEEKPSKRKKILSLTSRLRELSEEDKSTQRNDDSTEQIITEVDFSFRNFYKFYTAIENSKQIELRKSLYKNAVKYAKLRADWFLVDREQRELMHEERRSAHNVFIDACNIMSRIMIKNGEDASWRKELGDDRKVIGDFACYLSFILGIKAR